MTAESAHETVLMQEAIDALAIRKREFMLMQHSGEAGIAG